MLESSKSDPFAELTIGTAIATSRKRLRTVADGCERLRTVANGCERLGNDTAQPPDPQCETGTLATYSGQRRYKIPASLLLAVKFQE